MVLLKIYFKGDVTIGADDEKLSALFCCVEIMQQRQVFKTGDMIC